MRRTGESGPGETPGRGRRLIVSEDHYRVVAEMVREAILTLDEDGLVVTANRAVERIFGRIPDEVVGRPFDLLVPGYRDRLAAAAQAALEDGPSELIEVEGRSGRGMPLALELSFSSFRSGERRLVAAVVRDVEHRKAVEKRLVAKHEVTYILGKARDLPSVAGRLLMVVSEALGARAGFLVMEEGGALRLVSAHTPPGDAALAAIAERVRRSPFDPEASFSGRVVRAGRSLFARYGDPQVAQDEELHAAGVRSVVGTPIVDGKAVGVLAFLFPGESVPRPDAITLLETVAEQAGQFLARKRVERRNAELLEAAERAVEMRDSFAALVSHELRNLLAVVLMKTELLRRGVKTPLAQAEAIQRSAERMKRLIDDLLDMASIEAGRFLIDRRPLDAAQLLTDACEQLQPLATAKGLRLVRRAAAGLGMVDGDRDRLLQVFANLGGNAVKFTPEGGTIVLSAEPAGRATRFEVADTGPGIPPELAPQVFDRFWRVKQGHRQGTGLGLSIAKGIVEAHGGTIGVETEPGRGSRFRFTVPADHEQ